MSKLKLSDWASVAEVIGAVAVVISLVYVGIQINGNTIEVREANRQELVNRSFVATGRVMENPELAGIMVKVAEGTPLSPQESMQYSYFVRAMLYDVQEAYLLFREDRLDDGYWETRRAIFRQYMSSAPALAVYQRDKALGALHREFVEWADGTLAKE